MAHDEVAMRKAQEDMHQMIEGGFHKELAKMSRAMFDAYKEHGFDDKQALELTKAILYKI